MARVKFCPFGHENPADALRCEADGCGASLADVAATERPAPTQAGFEVGPGAGRETAASVAADASGGPASGPASAALAFDWGEVRVVGSLNVGRDAEFSPIAGRLLALDSISRKHARLAFEGTLLIVQDLQSTNGTFLNGRLIRPGVAVPVGDGDQIAFSSEVVARIRLGGSS